MSPVQTVIYVSGSDIMENGGEGGGKLEVYKSLF